LKELLPFEKYINSTYVQEYNRDVRRKNYIIKYVSLIAIDPQDTISLKKLVQNLILFRNIFSKDAFLNFFLNGFKENEKQTLGIVVYDMFVKSKIGEVGEDKDFLSYAIELHKYVDYKHIINKHWKEMQQEQQLV
jgi:hypothetical protein